MKYQLENILDIQRLQSALDSLYISSRIPSAIIDNEGVIHTGSGWQDVCTKFHRIHPETRKRCIESDLYISRHILEGTPSIIYKCPHGLVDSATPVIIEGEHIGNVFTGQLFLEEPDLDSFRAQARTYGFDEEEYIDAVKKVPIIPEHALRENLAFIAHLTGMLAEMGLKRAREKEAELRLRESEARLFEAQKIARLGYYVLDVATGAWTSSKILDDVFGIGDEYLRDVKGWSLLLHPEDRPSMLDYFRNDVLGKKNPFDREYRIVRASDRSVRWVHGLGNVSYDPRGTPVTMIGTIQDVTERKQAEEEKRNLERQVQQAQKLESLGVLAGGIAHDFNNLLMVVMGHAELASKGIPPMSPARENLSEITTAARRAADLCRQMLAYAGKTSFALERVALRELVEEMANLLRTAISKKAILTLNLEPDLPPIEADPSQIRQIAMNLIINASEAIGDRSGVIRLSVGATRCDEEFLRTTGLHEDLAPGLYVHLEVTDTGSGMDARTRSRIFEPFFSTKFAGRGLGLAAVLGIVRAHKGALKVRSEPGKGTTFKIFFPALADGEGATRSPEPAPLDAWRGKGTILLVDDEESLIALGARMLEHLGFTVLTAPDGLQAVERYRDRGKEIDLVLMDLTMPHMDGAEAFVELRRLNPDVRVVLASGYGLEDVESRFAGKGLDGVLQKPYTLARLRESLSGLMPSRSNGEG